MMTIRKHLATTAVHRGLWTAGMAAALAPMAFAQTTASLTGTVQDNTGAVIPNAHVVLLNEESNDRRELDANASGFFNFAGIKPGTYSVDIKASGFQETKQTGITVNPGDVRNLTQLMLNPGGTNVEVNVQSSANAIEPQDSGERSALLSTRDIQRLTIQSRNISELLKILPGVTTTANGVGNGAGFNFNDASAVGSAVGNGLSTNGAPYRGGTAYLLDGASIIDPGCACNSIATVNPDMTQEVKVQTANFGADAPQGPIVVNAISRSGTSNFHGQAYIYARNGVLNSNTWQNNNAGAARQQNAYYYPGGSLGGPVLIPGTGFNKNRKLLFWAGYEYFWQNLASTPLQSYVPTAAMRAGNFSANNADNARLCAASGGISAARVDFCNDLTGTVTPNGTTLTSSQIPTSQLDPGALALLNLFPQPNVDPASNGSGYNYYSATNAQHNGYIYRVRGDYNISDRDKVYVSYQHGHDVGVTFAHIYYTPSYAVAYPGGNLLSTVNSNVISGNWIHIFNSAMTNELRIAVGKLSNPYSASNLDAVSKSNIGYTYNTIYSTASTLAPSINTAGSRTFADISQPDIFQENGTFANVKLSPSVADDLSFVYKSHSFKIGFYWSRAQNEQGTYGYANGSLSYASGLKTDAVTGLTIGSSNPLANFLMGISSGFSQVNKNPLNKMYSTTAAGYVQDNWKVTPRLTLNLGLRLNHIGRWQDTSGMGLAVWRPERYAADVAAGKTFPGVSWHGEDASIPMSGSPVQSVFLEPRLGFAYDTRGNGKTVVRGGWAVYRWNDQYNDYAGPLTTAQGVKTYNSPGNQAITLAQISALGASGADLGSAASSVYATSQTDDGVGTTYAYNFTVSQRTFFNSLLEVGYVGNNTVNLLMGGQSSSTNIGGSGFINQNKIPLGGLFQPDPVTGAAAPADRENVPNIADYYPLHAGYGTNGVYVGTHVGYANYNAAQVSWQKQAGRVSFNLNYTYSKALGIVNSTVDAFSVHGNYGVLNIDRPHVVNTSYAFELGQPVHGNKLLDGLANGWTISGTTSWQAGGNLQANSSQNLGLSIQSTTLNHTIGSSTYFGTPVQSVLPVLTCNPKANLKTYQKVNMDCFSAPQIGSQGIRQAPYLSGASYFNTDVGVYKTFHITEHNTLQFRAQAFNWLNHALPGFNNSDPITIKLQTADNTNFRSQVDNTKRGITDTKFGQRVVQFALKYNF